MFHRASTTPIKPISQKREKRDVSGKMEKKEFRNRVESSAVERYAKSQNEIKAPENLANQNVNAPIEVSYETQNEIKVENKKESTPMNNPEPQNKDESQMDDKKVMTPQGRDVNIPGNNFQRPGQAGRPSYPGSYVANTSYSPASSDNGRKLVIGSGITMSGEIESCEHLIVEGTIEATLRGASVLDIAESGAFLGTVEIEEANIAGRFEGDITVRGRLTIEATGQVVGSISYKELAMEAGAVIDGSISPIGSENAVKAPNKKSNTKAQKSTQNNGAELPFADNAAEAAE